MFKTVNKGLKFYTEGVTGYVDVKDVVKALVLLQNSSCTNDQFILVGENCSYRHLLSQIAHQLGQKPPKKAISKKVLLLFASLDALINKLFRTRRKLLKATVRSLYNERSYEGTKIMQELDFNYKPLEKTIERISLNYRRDFN